MRLAKNSHPFMYNYKPLSENFVNALGIMYRRYYSSYPRKKNLRENRLNVTRFNNVVSQLPPRFNAEDLCGVLYFQDDPYVCLELFNYASQQPRFRHEVPSYYMVIKKLGRAKLYDEMDGIVKQVFAIPTIGSVALFNMMICFYVKGRKLTRAVNVFRHMRKSAVLGCRPSIRTYNLLFGSLLSKGSNTYINRMYMETVRCLFKQMVDDGIEPDIFSLNTMIKGYIDSLHVNDALRIFHQMAVVYSCKPNSNSYDYLIHGLCCQGRTRNARELYEEMKNKGFVPSGKAYNSLVNSLAMGGEFEEAVRILWEMNEKRRLTDLITYRTLLDEICRHGNVGKAMRLLEELQNKRILDWCTYKELLYVVKDDFGNSDDR
ncbi:hypothetical protein GIB67_036590 [Kingdonia uniflora]|uniref:Pentatricopeptide repeat-containing protein n=1 Tax=Kingdonia uniflora TaxID=39325 RepID=A0A7J7MER4_9MAGN|nr:hypothetical protein GIB67_036590 [Kingdonia uniflora]